MKRILSLVTTLALTFGCLLSLAGCGSTADNKVVIYTSAEDYRVEYMQQRLKEQFPDYVITIEYMSTGDHAAKLTSEGRDTECDITYDLEYGYMQKLADQGVLADLSGMCDFSLYTDDTVKGHFFIPEYRNGGAVILAKDVFTERGLSVPASYQDLLDPQYKGLISMPNPKSSGTGYMFYKNLVNAWGEEKALAYFDQLTPNILQYTSSGSGPVNALLQKEAAIGLGMTGQAVVKMNEQNANLQIIYFDEGSPFSLYGQGIISGKETRECVKNVFQFLYDTYGYENCEKFFAEPIYKNRTFDIANYPKNIVYGDMSNDTMAEKERLLALWKY